MADADDRVWKVITSLMCGYEMYSGSRNTHFAIQYYEEALKGLPFIKGRCRPEDFQLLRETIDFSLNELFIYELREEVDKGFMGAFSFENFVKSNPQCPSVARYNQRMGALKENMRILDGMIPQSSEIPC